jgi:hypothetical protein
MAEANKPQDGAEAPKPRRTATRSTTRKTAAASKPAAKRPPASGAKRTPSRPAPARPQAAEPELAQRGGAGSVQIGKIESGAHVHIGGGGDPDRVTVVEGEHRKNWFMRHKKVTALLVAVAAVVVIGSCHGTPSPQPTSTGPSGVQVAPPTTGDNSGLTPPPQPTAPNPVTHHTPSFSVDPQTTPVNQMEGGSDVLTASYQNNQTGPAYDTFLRIKLPSGQWARFDQGSVAQCDAAGHGATFIEDQYLYCRVVPSGDHIALLPVSWDNVSKGNARVYVSANDGTAPNGGPPKGAKWNYVGTMDVG